MKKKWIKRNSQKRSRKMAIKRGWHIVIVYKYINQFFQRKIPSRNGLKLSHWLRPGGVVALRNLIRRISRTYQWITSKRLYKIQAKKGIQSCQRNKKAGSYFQEKKIRMTIQLGLFCNIQIIWQNLKNSHKILANSYLGPHFRGLGNKKSTNRLQKSMFDWWETCPKWI